jgi:hypothetical protein
MERLINSDSMVTQLWNPIALSNLEEGGDKFSNTSILTRTTLYKVPEGIYNNEWRQSSAILDLDTSRR